MMKRYFHRHAYRWHRITSLIVALPVFLWTISGFLHPVMNSFKPEIKNHSLPITLLDSSKIRLGIGEVLNLHKIKSIQQFRIIEMYGSFYYQVKQPGVKRFHYISCFNGQMLLNGDLQYAAFLGQRYVSENNANSRNDHHGAAANLKTLVKNHGMNPDKVNITDVQPVESFTEEYKPSNVLLPVYKVQFDRQDGLRLYIDPLTGKLATAVNDQKAWFTRFFAVTHSWNFMNGIGAAKHLIIGLIAFTCLLSSFLGFYVYNITTAKKGRITNSRRAHRVMGNVFVITTMLYALSGGWHSIHKLRQKETIAALPQVEIPAEDLAIDMNKILHFNDSSQKPVNLAVVKWGGELIWQATAAREGKLQKIYFNADLKSSVKDGDEQYARFLAGQYSGKAHHEIVEVKKISRFNNRYSMMKKRLPVIEVTYKGGSSWYIETSTGMLAAVANDQDAAERFSFSNLHMHHYWEDLFGKEKGRIYKDLVLVTSTLGLLLLALTGIAMYRSKIKKRKSVTHLA